MRGIKKIVQPNKVSTVNCVPSITQFSFYKFNNVMIFFQVNIAVIEYIQILKSCDFQCKYKIKSCILGIYLCNNNL